MSASGPEIDRNRPPWTWDDHPITSFLEYQASLRHFIEHWQLVNSYLRSQGRPDLVLPDGTTRETLIHVAGALPGRIAALDAALRELSRLQSEQRHQSDELHRQMWELRDALPAPPGQPPSLWWRPVFAAMDAGGPRWISALETAASAWERLHKNNDTPDLPLVLPGEFTATEFRSLAESYRATGRALRLARRRWRYAVKQMAVLDVIGHWAGRYRTFVRFRLGLPEALREPFPLQHPRSYCPHTSNLSRRV